jgi:hypothetical protein
LEELPVSEITDIFTDKLTKTELEVLPDFVFSTQMTQILKINTDRENPL